MKAIMKIFNFFLITLFTSTCVFAQSFSINKIEPPNWWIKMQHDKIQLMVYGKNLTDVKVKCNSKNLGINKIHKVDNPDYLFIDITISRSIKEGNYKLIFSNKNESKEILFPVHKRENTRNRFQGFGNDDIIYLLMPDRFANGDTTNDSIEGFYDSLQTIPTQARKGGDITGVINHLEYIKNFGATALWLTPLLENNTFRSYHGYSTTNHYKVDPRLGDIYLYKNLVTKAHEMGLKIIMDHVANHIAIDHEWMKSLPMKNWINGSVENHLPANHNKMAFFDLYADSITIKEVQEGWFTSYMPDLNHENPFLENYLIQNTIWWIESTGIDGIREDTYPYCNQKFMARWANEILNEYPTLKILGEVWTGESDYLSCYQSDSKLNKERNTYLYSVTDFALRDSFVKFLQGRSDLYEIFNTIAKDYLYPNPNALVTFIDNHDVGRAMFYADSNLAKFKLAFHILLTTRGIPQIFYGTEIGMKENEDHGTLRKKFPGGFPNDSRNAFTKDGRTESENVIYNYLSKLLEIRKNHKALTSGKLIHFPPQENTYVYLREFEDEVILNIVNASNNTYHFNNKYFTQMKNISFVQDLFSNKIINASEINIEPMSAHLLKIIKNKR